MNTAIFLDRDGVINEEVGAYITTKDDFKVLEHAITNIKKFNEAGVKVVVITNQGGIAKGMYTELTLKEIHESMVSELARAGAFVDLIYHCPHHPDFGRCLCRKPASLLVQKAIARLHIDQHKSAFIGDKQRDMDAASGAGVAGYLIDSNQDWTDIADEIILKMRQ